MISIVHVTNPLQPYVGRKTHELPFLEGKPLDEYLRQVFTTCDHFTVSVNGGIIPGDLWCGVILRNGDFVVAAPVVANGNLLRTLASVAVLATAAIVTQGASLTLGGFTLGFTGLGLGATASSIVAGAITVAGNLLVGALLGPSAPSSKTPSASYDPDGPKSLARSGTVIPKGAGTMRWGGNVIASFTDLEGLDQYINALVCYGFGPARTIAEIQINGKDITSYQNVQYYVRLGSNTQLPIPNFNRVVNGYPQDVQCLAGVPVVVPGTGTLTQAIQVDIAFPNGAFVLTSLSNTIPIVITYTIEYSVSGSNNWQQVVFPYTTADVVSYNPDGSPINPHDWCVVATDMPPNSGIVYHLDNGPHTPGDPWTGTIPCENFIANGNHTMYDKSVVGEWQPTNPLLNQVLVLSFRSGYQDFVGASRQPLYNRTTIYGLAPAKYDVRVTKYGSARLHDNAVFGDNNAPNVGEQVWIHSVNEISLLDLAYPNMILVGIRALATNQLNGQDLNVTALITHGLRSKDQNLLPAAFDAFEEDNPACVAADMMLDDLYGGGEWPGIRPENITRFIDEWMAWAALNDELVDDGNGGSIRRHVFNGVFDSEGSLWDAVTTVGRMSRAALIPMGKDYGVFVDQPSDPVQMFTMGNIVKDSFQETWLAIDDRANQVEIQFADSTRFYKQDNPLVYMDPDQQNAGVIIKNVRIDGKGITIPAQAWHLARFKQRNNQFLLRTGSFKVDIDAVACRPGNVAILQHDIPQWGWGGRLLPGSTASALIPDRSDIPFVAGTSYNAVVLHPALQRYAGTITSVTPVVDSVTGRSLGTVLVLSSFDNDNRVTRCIVGGVDSPILSSAAGTVTIQPAAGFAGASGQAYQLWDTDVLETRAVTGISAGGVGNSPAGAILLGTPLSQVPADFSTYVYGPVGAQKLIRIVNVRKSSEFRATLEWIDYDENCYVDATPVIGETSAQITSNPGVTALTGEETFEQVSGSYITYAQLAWKLGPDTAGVAIYGFIVGGNGSDVGGLPTLLARLTNQPTTWKTQVTPGVTWTYIAVGFGQNDVYAAFKTAPTVTIAAVGVATNLLLGSSFASGFTYWNLTPRAGDTLTATLGDDGQANYTVAGTALTAAQTLLYQVVQPSKWSIGGYLMLSAYLQDSCASSSAPNVGQLVAFLIFLNASGGVISTVSAAAALNGVTPSLRRVTCASTAVPTGTVQVAVSIAISGSGLNVPVGSILSASHLLLENSSSGQTLASEWADIDAMGHILDLFQTGSSTGLRVQGSTVPSFTGSFSPTFTATTAAIPWSNLVILWADAAYTFVPDSSVAITGLTAVTRYYAYPYFDVVNGGVQFAAPSTPVGSPAILSTAYDAGADAACKQDGRVPLAVGGLTFTTAATGSTGGGGGGGPIPPKPPPVRYPYGPDES